MSCDITRVTRENGREAPRILSVTYGVKGPVNHSGMSEPITVSDPSVPCDHLSRPASNPEG